mmetsp:Transcript_26231/g.54646  ORF Transcript_26231/g.54646 Transcript_26231/m.54646 type:complete len:419 (+) Transcript_26231:185-1441(+)
MPGFSGGQRKMLMFELIYQRTKNSTDLLICLDEPFAGVTDDFLPYIMGRVEEMRKNHNLLLVTNDHVDTLKSTADNIITVSAIDRTTVKINDKEGVSRVLALNAVSNGNDYEHSTEKSTLQFFFDVEISASAGLGGVLGFTIFAMTWFLLTHYDSKQEYGATVLVGLQIIAFFCINPYLIALADWRDFMTEESEALMHASVQTNKALKSLLTLTLLGLISITTFCILNLCIDGYGDAKWFVAMLFDSASLTLPFICFGLYTPLPLQFVQILASLPFLFMIFCSTTFSPGAGLEGVRELRWLFARFYFWCMIPEVKGDMEWSEGNEIPSDGTLVLYCIMSGCLGLFLFLIALACWAYKSSKDEVKKDEARAELEASKAFQELQKELFGDRIIVASPKASAPGAKGGFKKVNQSIGDDAL